MLGRLGLAECVALGVCVVPVRSLRVAAVFNESLAMRKSDCPVPAPCLRQAGVPFCRDRGSLSVLEVCVLIAVSYQLLFPRTD